ncbi:hypothetical protein X947_5166 [Burkholderia pseudomallei MSHR7334]|nr:hypothetical protein DP43_4327 [Burkholderia pseudomallei]KGS76359.1 hypothetical protein X947_5166 [Burkholderia pseudomallei MSHR7334]KGW37786.1 hypothetical protein Y047_5906 [Burkholderia pseudomallei MSHR3016]
MWLKSQTLVLICSSYPGNKISERRVSKLKNIDMSESGIWIPRAVANAAGMPP